MSVPAALPIGLTDEFATDPSRQAIWLAFLKKNQLAVTPLLEVVTTIRTTLEPALIQAATLGTTAGAVDVDKLASMSLNRSDS